MRRWLAMAVIGLLGGCATAPSDEPVFPPAAPTPPPVEAPPPMRAEPGVESLELRLTGADRGELAGVKVGRLATPDRLTQVELDRVVEASRAGRMPLSFVLYLEATNPRSNPVAARLDEVGWTLHLDGVETVSGTVRTGVDIAPGESAIVVLSPSLDLRRHFDRSDSELVVLAVEALERGTGVLVLEVRPDGPAAATVPLPSDVRLRLE